MDDVNIGYYRQPTLVGDEVIFVCETDLWRVSCRGGLARRLTAHQLDASWPTVAPGGRWLAFSAKEEGATEVYLMPAVGGRAERLTYQGSNNLVCGFTPDGSRVIYASVAEQPFTRQTRLWTVPISGGAPEVLPVGPARRISYGADGRVVMVRREQEIAHWKRYRGGTRGDLWVDLRGDGHYNEILRNFNGNLATPWWVGERLYFIADHEGHGNVYSCAADGSDLRRQTHHQDYYARALSSDGRRLVYQCGARLYLLKPDGGPAQPIDIQVNSSKPQLLPRFVHASRYLQGYALDPSGAALLVTTRGRPFVMGNWEREATQIGARDGVRYRLSAWLNDGKRLVTIADDGGEEALEIHTVAGNDGLPVRDTRLEALDIGHVRALTVAPNSDVVALANHRCEVLLVDLATASLRVLDRSEHDEVQTLRFSADGCWLTYAATKALPYAQIFIANVGSGEVHAVTRQVGEDSSPVFDPEGRYLYFLSARVFDPIYESTRFDLAFPKGMKPYLLTLRADIQSPFNPPPLPLSGGEAKGAKADEHKADEPKADEPKADEQNPNTPKPEAPKTTEGIAIDFAGIADRILEFPVPEGRYGSLLAAKNKVYYSELAIEGSLARQAGGERPLNKLMTFDFDSQKAEVYAEGVHSFSLSRDGKSLAYRARDRLRVVKAAAKPEAKETRAGRSSGWIDLERLRVEVQPQAEWRQMFRELWRLQRDHFWTTDLSSVDWAEVYQRYLPILQRVATRSEFSDLVWEVQGELGTSHAYEYGGDLRPIPALAVGKLGADWRWDGTAWLVERLVRGDSWDRGQDSPLAASGLEVAVGDRLLAIDGMPLSAIMTPARALWHKAGTDVAVVMQRGDSAPRRLVVKPLASDLRLRYRNWVESNRARVHERSQGRLGYVHVPDMSPHGYAEFFRYYTIESRYDGLVVDVRFNGGGHVSQLLLEKLTRKRLSYVITHHRRPHPQPQYAVAGPIVAVTNEYAGSDGDIFSHSFKMLQLGPLVGTRTWGGVIGIDSRNSLVDGTVVTQPEYAYWFQDVGFGVENYGTDPDIEVVITPQDYANGIDRQLELAIDIGMLRLVDKPVSAPDFAVRPNLSRSPLS